MGDNNTVTMTITEALAELKTLVKRIEKKRQSVTPYGMRQGIVVDPMAKEGGSRAFIERERQALRDLEERLVRIRTEIQATNHRTSVTVEGKTRTVAEWLTWRKEVASGVGNSLRSMYTSIQKTRDDYTKKGGSVSEKGVENPTPIDIIVNIDEGALLREIEQHETILGTLDGKLSLVNATTLVTF